MKSDDFHGNVKKKDMSDPIKTTWIKMSRSPNYCSMYFCLCLIGLNIGFLSFLSGKQICFYGDVNKKKHLQKLWTDFSEILTPFRFRDFDL